MTKSLFRPLLFCLLLVLAGALAWALLDGRPLAATTSGVSAEVVALQGGGDAAGYTRAVTPRQFTFPRDHGPHDDYQTEWWYYTGNVDTPDGRHLGYQLTFFRRAIAPITATVTRTSDWATNQVYFAHFAVTDVAGGAHYSTERFSRGAAGLAGATGEPFSVWLEDWQVTSLAADGGKVRLTAESGSQGVRESGSPESESPESGNGVYALDLTLEAEKAPVLHGEGGLSAKSDAPGNASYYYSFTRMRTEGTITVNGQALAVTGLSWMDHEWSTSALGQNVVGWDWFSLQLADRREIMYFVLRRADESVDPVSSGTLVAPDGGVRHLASGDVRVDVLGKWTSPHSGTTYPAGWRMTIPAADTELMLTPWLADQEMRVSFTYWEGAVRVEGGAGGSGYVELTGYAR